MTGTTAHNSDIQRTVRMMRGRDLQCACQSSLSRQLNPYMVLSCSGFPPLQGKRIVRYGKIYFRVVQQIR